MNEVNVRKKLDSGAVLKATDDFVAVSLLASSSTALSSAVLNGGLFSRSTPLHVINYKVPSDYDGVSPNPVELLKRMATQQGFDPSATIGLLTAASMKTLCISSRSADGVVVDVIVTAGISNARAAGADADYLGLGDDQTTVPAPGTINTIVLTNAVLSPSALVEAHSIAIESKCAACVNLGICCAKSGELSQGTGTDATVVVNNHTGQHITYAGKHTLFAELVGQAVKQATSDALMTNIHYIYGSRWRYNLYKWRLDLVRILRGARPCIPLQPMMPVPAAPLSISMVGYVLVGLVYISPLSQSARVLLAAIVWDRYLGSVPLQIHPVVLVGNLISAFLKLLPKQVYSNPTLGFLMGWILLGSVVGMSMAAAGLVRHFAPVAADVVVQHIVQWHPPMEMTAQTAADFGVWILDVLFVNSSCTLQLLCTIALQMARFLERRQVPQARAQLSWLCSRDPSTLNAADLAGGTLESLSENLSDSFVAPMFWYVLFGPLGALGYRTINTLDSRVGYHGKYEWLGKPSARLDDLINLIPARLAAVLLVLAATVVEGCHPTHGWKAAWNDCSQCESPNAGWPMSAMAGLLGVLLEKKGEYQLGGSVVDKGNFPSPNSIRQGHQVAQLAGILGALLAVAVCGCSIG